MSYETLTKKSLEKLPPFNLEAEQAVLGAILLTDDVKATIATALTIMDPEEFYRKSHEHIFNACRNLAEQHGTVDLLMLRNVLDRERLLDDVGGTAYLVGLVDVVPTAANIQFHARIVHEKALMRSLLNKSIELATRAYDDKEPAAALIEEARQNFESLWRLSFEPENTFWYQDNYGKAKGIDTEEFLNFLIRLGYYMLEINENVLFVRNVENILSETTWVKSINKTIKDALNTWCKTTARRDVWQILVDKGKLFSTQVLTGLETLQGDFYKDAPDNCTLFFQNGALEITASRILWKPYNEIPGYLWEDQISEHHYFGQYNRQLKTRIRQDMYQALKARDQLTVLTLRRVLNRIQYFELEHDTAHDNDIFTILKKMSEEAGEALDYAQRAQRSDLAEREAQELTVLDRYYDLKDVKKSEYQRFLEFVSAESVEEYTGKTLYVNNLHAFEYALAYLIHGYNHKANMRAVVLADSNPSFLSNGRRGKGVILQALKHIKGKGLVVKEDGKAFNNGQFKFQLVRPNTRILILDDVAENFDFSWLYSAITDAFVVESKGFKRIAFDFEDTPRFVITTNHPCYDEGVSSSERAVLLPVADYFTAQGRTPYQEFGHMLFDDWDSDEWDCFFDYIIRIIQQYLQRSDPSVIPVIDLTIFNANKLLLKVPEPMVTYLDELQKEKDYERDEIIKDLEVLGIRFRTSQEFSKALHTYCRLRGYKLKHNTKDGRYISDGKQYVRLIPVTPDFFDTKFQKPKQ
jgi:uncharacterized protein YqeY